MKLTAHESASTPADAPRRTFGLQFLTGGLSALILLIPSALGTGFFLHPLWRKRTASSDGYTGRKDSDGFLRLDLRVEDLPADGKPVAYKVFDDKLDAWNLHQNIEVGTVWLRRVDEKQVLALSSICPHLGCMVDFRASGGDFFCPCHTSSFDLSGERTNKIPPRAMDKLEVRLKPETGSTIWLKYETYRGGTAEKIPV